MNITQFTHSVLRLELTRGIDNTIKLRLIGLPEEQKIEFFFLGRGAIPSITIDPELYVDTWWDHHTSPGETEGPDHA